MRMGKVRKSVMNWWMSLDLRSLLGLDIIIFIARN